MKMKLKMVILSITVLLLTGCWDYISLDEMTIITGIAIDKDEDVNKYKLTFEFIDIAKSTKETGIKAGIIESMGSTIFDAVRNAKKRTMSKLYFSDAQVVIVSNQIVKKDGLASVINWFIRDFELRETINIVISKEETAGEMLTKSNVDNPVTSFVINKIIEEDNRITASTANKDLYKVYNNLKTSSASLALPVVHNTKNNNKQEIELDGIATFKKDKLIGYLSSTESKAFLFIDNSLKGGLLTLRSEDSSFDNISLEVADSKTSKSYSYKNNKFKITLKVETKVVITEYEDQSAPLDEKDINSLTKKAELMIEKDIKKVIKKAKKEFKTDIFCFGDLIYRNNPKLWKKVEKDWDREFLDLEVDVEADVLIKNTASIK